MNTKAVTKALEVLGAVAGFNADDADQFELATSHRVDYNDKLDKSFNELLVCLSNKEITVREFQEETKLLLYKHILQSI